MRLTHCAFNINTASVDLRLNEGTQINIYTPEVDDEICPTIPMQTEIDWLYNEPLMYAGWCSPVNWNSMQRIWLERMGYRNNQYLIWFIMH